MNRAAGVTVRQAIEGFWLNKPARMADSTLKGFRSYLISSPNRANCRNPEKFSPTLMDCDRSGHRNAAFVDEPDLVANSGSVNECLRQQASNRPNA
jgi:hypothetical protein